MRKPIVRILSGLLFFVFLAGIMPREYIHHAIFDHEDDVHPLYKKGEIVITKKHNHCTFLSFEFTPFLAAEHQHITLREPSCFTGYISPVYAYHYNAPFSVTATRGPPGLSLPVL